MPNAADRYAPLPPSSSQALDALDVQLRGVAQALKEGDVQALDSVAQALRGTLTQFSGWTQSKALHPSLTPESQLRLNSACAHLSVLRQALTRASAHNDMALNVLMPAPPAAPASTYEADGRSSGARPRGRSIERA